MAVSQVILTFSLSFCFHMIFNMQNYPSNAIFNKKNDTRTHAHIHTDTYKHTQYECHSTWYLTLHRIGRITFTDNSTSTSGIGDATLELKGIAVAAVALSLDHSTLLSCMVNEARTVLLQWEFRVVAMLTKEGTAPWLGPL